MNKRIIAIGTVIVILGFALILKAGPTAERVYLEPEENAEWRLNSTDNKLIELDSDETYDVFIKKGGVILDISVTDFQGNSIFNEERCEEINKNELQDCEYEWVEYGSFETHDCPCEISFDATEEILFVKEGEGGQKSKVDEYTAAICGGIITIGIGILVITISGGIALFGKNQVEFINQEE